MKNKIRQEEERKILLKGPLLHLFQSHAYRYTHQFLSHARMQTHTHTHTHTRGCLHRHIYTTDHRQIKEKNLSQSCICGYMSVCVCACVCSYVCAGGMCEMCMWKGSLWEWF